MPRVPQYERRVGIAPLPNARMRTAPTPISEGAGVGAAIADFGDVMARAGLTLADRVFEEQRERADQAAILESHRRLGELEHLVLTASDRGFLQTRGKEALSSRQAALEEFDISAGEIGKNLTTERQRLAFEREREQRRSSMLTRMDGHIVQEVAAYESGEAKAAIASSINLTIANADNRPRIDEELARVDTIIDSNARVLGLRGPEAIAQAKDEFRNNIHEGVVTRLLTLDKDQDAQRYLEEFRDKGQITGETLARLEEKVNVSSTEGEGLRAAGEIWLQMGPASDDGPIQFDRMEQALRDRFKDKPKVFQAARRYLAEKQAAVLAGRKERDDQAVASIWGKVLEGQPLSAISRSPEFINAPERVKVTVRDYIENQITRQANLEYLRGSRANALEGAAYQRLLRNQHLEAQRNYAAYAEKYADPTVLKAMTLGQVMAALPEVGPELHKTILNEWQALQRSGADPASITVDMDMFREVAFEGGLDYVYTPPGQLNEAQRGAYGRLLDSVKQAISREQGSSTTPLSPERKREIAEALVSQKVRVDQWGPDWPYIGATINPGDRTKAYVLLEDIDASPQIYGLAYQDYLTYLRALPEGRGLNDQQLRTRFNTRIQNAMGRRFSGASRAEVEAALKGQ